MLKSLKTLTRTAMFAVAVLSGAAMFATQANAAATTNTAPTFAAGFQAPMVNSAPTFASGLNARFQFAVTAGAGANSDGMELIALYFNSSNAYVGFSRMGAPTTTTNAGGATKLLTVGLTTPVGATQVVFIAVPRGDETAANSADDTFSGIAANRAVGIIIPGGTTDVGTVAMAGTAFSDVGAGAAFGITQAAGASSGEIAALAALAAINNSTNRQALSSTYSGPALTTATKAAASGATDMRVTFNASLASIGDNTAVTTQVRPQAAAVDAFTSVLVKGAVTAGNLFSFKIDNNNGAFVGVVDNVDVALGGTDVADRAGNVAAPTSNFSPVSVYATPDFASSGTAKVMLSGAGTAVNTDAELLELNSTTGTGNNGETFIFTVRMAENFDGTGVDGVDDIVMTPAQADTDTTVTSSGAGASTFTVTVTLSAETQAIRVNQTTGILEYSTDDNAGVPTWTAMTFGLTVGATALTTADGGVLAAANTPVNLYNSLASTPVVATLDSLNGTSAGVDGTVDGVTVDFLEDVSTVNSTGFSIFDRVTPATTVTPTVAAHPTDASKVNVSATQATLVGYLETGQTQGANMNTAATSATPIPYDFSLTSATMTYARVYNVTSGALKTLPNIASGGTISDGAGPVVVKVARSTGLTNDPEGTLVIYTSEGMNANPAIGFVKTQNGSLALDILNNVDDGGTASATGTRSQTSVTVGSVIYNAANNTATFSDVDNDVLTALTAVGVTGGNSGGNGFQDAAGNFSGEHTITPDAAAAITTIAPTFDKAVAVVNSSGNITNILVFLTENVTLVGTNLNQRFSLSFNGATVTPSSATIASNTVNLVLPGNGVTLRQVEGTTNTITFDGTADVQGLADSDGNDVSDFGPSNIDIPANSDNLFSMEIRGTVTTDGSTAVAQGTLVRADLMRFNTTSVIDRGSATVPCNCTGNTKDVALTFTGGTSAFDSALYEAGIRGATTIPVWVSVVHDGAANEQGTGVSASVALTNPGAGSGQTSVYLASMNVTTGAITSTGTTVSGSVVFRTGPLSYTAVESARYGIVNGTDGAFRLNVGSNSSPLSSGDMFVIVSVRQNGTTTSSWVPVTFADKSLTGYLPFAQDVKTTVTAGMSDSPFIDFQTNAGNNGVLTAAFRLDRILSVDLADSTGYQLVGTKGELARATATDFRAYRFFTTVNTDTGAPYALWKFNQATDDEAFTLVGNGVKSSFSVNEHNVDNIGSSFASHYGIAYRDSGNSVTVLNRDTLFYPVTASTATSASLAAGWHLITVQAAVASPGNLGNSGSDNTAVGMIIEAGARRNGDGAGAVRTGVRTWIRSTTNNSLTALEAGKAYFVYLNAADSTWTGQ